MLSLTGCGSREDAEAAAKAAANPADLINRQGIVHGIEIKSVEITNPLRQDWVTEGRAIYDMKCLACHRLTGDRIVGPGWAGITKRRDWVWIMNMITNVDVMLETDEEAQKLLELCLIRMPNQNISADEARMLLELMRHNDGES